MAMKSEFVPLNKKIYKLSKFYFTQTFLSPLYVFEL